jgi:hypothetical protein
VAVKVTDWPKTEGLADEVTVVVVLAWLTVWVKAGDVLGLKLVLPLEAAVSVWLPADSVVVLNVAVPLVRGTAGWAVPSRVKTTLPVGVPTPGATALTVAVKVTACPKTEGLAEDVTAVLVLALLTVCVKLAEVLGLKFPSPL